MADDSGDVREPANEENSANAGTPEPTDIDSSDPERANIISVDRVLERMSIPPSLFPGWLDAFQKAAGVSSLVNNSLLFSGIAGNNAGALIGLNKSIADAAGLGPTSFISELMSKGGNEHLSLWGGLDWRKFSGISVNTLSAGRYFKNSDEQDYAYSREMLSPASYFERDEVVVDSFESLNSEISKLIKLNPDLPLVWRGQQNHEWGLKSGLYLALERKNGVKPPSDRPRGAQPYPGETEMQDAEAKLISYAREHWRLDEMPALELLARLQHYGAPTRLIDVTRNPYIAAWFAIESGSETEDVDSRLFALATRPVAKKGQEALVAATDTSVRLSELPQTQLPFWHYWVPGEERQMADWGTGSRRRVWVPPAYDQRIVSQNAAFVLDGVPIVSAKTAPYFKRGAASEYWNKADLLASSSIYAKTYSPSRKPRSNAPNFSPTFTFRITREAKKEIRQVLESRFSYSFSTIYPDISAAGRFLKDHFDELTTWN